MAAGNGNDQRVTNALLRVDIQSLKSKLDQFRHEVQGWQKSSDGRIRDLEDWQIEHKAKSESNPNPKEKQNGLRYMAEKFFIPVSVVLIFWFLTTVLPQLIALIQQP